MKKILFDLTKTQPMNGTKFHGGAKYGIAIFKKLVDIAPDKIAAYYDDSIYIDESVIKLCHSKNIIMEKKRDASILSISRKYGNILYSPLIDSTYLTDDSFHIIVTIHGLRVLELPFDEYEIYYRKFPLKRVKIIQSIYKFFLKRKRKKNYICDLQYQKKSLTKSNISFVTVSNHSKYSLLTFIPQIKANDIQVFFSPSTIDDSIRVKEKSNIAEKYYLIVSGNRWIKNSVRAIIALDELFTEHPEISGIVIVTGIKQKSDLTINIKNPNRFVFVGYVDETKLTELYHNAYLFIYPSLNEGFGYPPLEAMHEGCPVIASAIASIPEICGNAVLYFNPYSIDEIKMRILQMENKSIRSEYIKKGFERESYIRSKQDEDLEKMAHYILSFLNNTEH
ncbi:glycosyltransferase [Fibrobacter succinogenes]|uniref:glycosyltransferase n=1 Tax=Fibrobacter succinogenes TaxID=833 RepID=UPI0015684202|nr:glycosyltransferase [Fibrobacter succinogenes]